MAFTPHVKRRAPHKDSKTNREKIKNIFRDESYGKLFVKENNLIQETCGGKCFLRNPVNHDKLEELKWEKSITNDTIVDFARKINDEDQLFTNATLTRKLTGKMDFTATEILVIAKLFELSGDEILDLFNLLPKGNKRS